MRAAGCQNVCDPFLPQVLDKVGAKSARAKTSTRVPMPIISTVSVPFDETPQIVGLRQQTAQDNEFQQSQR